MKRAVGREANVTQNHATASVIDRGGSANTKSAHPDSEEKNRLYASLPHVESCFDVRDMDVDAFKRDWPCSSRIETFTTP